MAVLPAGFKALLRGPLGWFYTTTMVQSVGFGLSLVLFLIYVHDVRHFSVLFATSLLAANAVVGLAASPVIGTLTDRFGPVHVFTSLVLLEVVALVNWAFADNAIWLVATSVLMALSAGAIFGPGSALLARLAPEELHQQSFGTNFMILNAGIGLGGLISAAVVNINRPETFTWLYLGTAFFCFLGIFPMLHIRSHGGPVDREHLSESESREGWRVVLADHRMVYLVVAAVVLLTSGYGSLDAGFSLFVVDQYHLPVRVVSIALTFNTATIVLAQLFVLRQLDGKSRTRIMALVSLFWTVSWIIIGAAVHTTHWLAIGLLCVAQTIFAIGETLWSPMGPSLVNQIAPEHLRGRYNAAFGLTWSLSSVLAPLLAGLFLGRSLALWWPYVIAGGALIGGFLMLGLRRRLTAEEDGRVVPASPAPAAEAI